LNELGDKVEAADKESVESAIAKLKASIAANNVEDMKADTDALQKAFFAVSEKIYKQPGQGGPGPEQPGGPQGPKPGEEGTYDADFKDVGGEG